MWVWSSSRRLYPFILCLLCCSLDRLTDINNVLFYRGALADFLFLLTLSVFFRCVFRLVRFPRAFFGHLLSWYFIFGDVTVLSYWQFWLVRVAAISLCCCCNPVISVQNKQTFVLLMRDCIDTSSLYCWLSNNFNREWNFP